MSSEFHKKNLSSNLFLNVFLTAVVVSFSPIISITHLLTNMSGCC